MNPLVGLSPAEMLRVLDEVLQELERQPPERQSTESENETETSKQDLFYSPRFATLCNDFRNTLKPLHEPPQVIVSGQGPDYQMQYNPEVSEQVKDKLKRFRHPRGDSAPRRRRFTARVLNSFEWMMKTQVSIADFLVLRQSQYLGSGHPNHLRPILIKDVAESLEFAPSTVSRLIRHLTLRLSNGRIILARQLTPGPSGVTRERVFHGLSELVTDPKCFRDGKWKIPCRVLAERFNSRYDLVLTARNMSTLRRIFTQSLKDGELT